jgi:malonyl-ACP decarboxylase
MHASNRPDVVISGIGITSAIGQGQHAFGAALLHGKQCFGVMRRRGRQRSSRPDSNAESPSSTAYLGAEIPELRMPPEISACLLRTTSFSAQVALATLQEAWQDARLDDISAERIGLVVGGSNFQQRELVCIQDTYRDRPQFVRPSYGICFLDSDLCGACTEQFPIRSFAHTVGGASASGQAAIIEAACAVSAGRVDACIAIGALMDLSYWECQGLRSLGAMGSDRYAQTPAEACRPFDRDRDGFIFGEACGVVVVESLESLERRGQRPHASITGWGVEMDRNRNPNPSVESEVAAIDKALRHAAIRSADIDYINPHGTASPLGDETELAALRRSGLQHAYLNATKSITGHSMSAAGAVEVIATVLQMKAGRLHPSNNLTTPIDPEWRWVQHESVPHTIRTALSLSFGFGGINTALCLQAPH